jgi:branched-chain amino acid transport system substrate-binding protein
MREIVRWAKQKNFKEIAILNPTDAAGQREAALLKQLTAAAGIKLVAAETYNPTDTNFTAQLVKIRSANPEFLYAGTIGAPAVLVFKQIRQMRLSMPIALHSAAFGGSFFTAIGGIKEAEGVFTPLERGALADNAAGDSAEQYQALNAALGRPGNQFQTVGWDFGILLEHALNTSDGTRDGIRDAIERTKDLPAIGGFFSFGPTNHGGKDQRGVLMGQLKDGKFVTAP